MLIDSLIALALIILSNVIVLSAICIIGTKFSKINTLCAIRIRQYFLSTLSTSIACCFLPTHVAAILFIALFFVYRKIIFINDSLELEEIYKLHNVDFQPILKLSCVLKSEYNGTTHKVSDRGCLYSFSQYINSAPYIFIFYCVKFAEQPQNTLIYGLEFFIAITALFIIIAKLIYKLSVSTPTSPFFLCSNLSYIPVAFVGVLYYVIAAFMFISTL